MDKKLGKAIPYGVYDVTENQGWVSVGIDHDTGRFATEAIRRWWKKMGARRHRGAKEILIIADGGGSSSNGSRCRLWKMALQDLANILKMPIHVCHFPPGTRKWNKIEHRMFCHITQNWRGRLLVSHEVIINLIANAATAQDQGQTRRGHVPDSDQKQRSTTCGCASEALVVSWRLELLRHSSPTKKIVNLFWRAPPKTPTRSSRG